MKSLFAKILAWFLFATLLTGITAAVVNVVYDDTFPPERLLRGLLRAHLDKAVAAYEAGGRPALDAYLRDVAAELDGPLRIVDAEGRDLRTGRPWREGLPVRGPVARRFGGPPRVTATTADGTYQALLPVPPRGLRDALFRPTNLFVLALAAMLCWALARHISRPVRELQQAVERFGPGETSVRFGSAREDELGELARAFDRMAGRIGSLVAAQRQLLLDISHELRSPLTRLTIAADLLRNDPSHGESLEQVEKEAARMNELVSELLLASRLESGEGRERFEAVMVDALAAEVAETVRFEAEAAGRGVEVTPAPPLPVQGDPELLRRAIENLLRNAVRHTAGGARVSVTLGAETGHAVLRVRDRGPGVDPSALPRLFDPFFRADEARDRASGGAGLGLTIARRAVEAHGGSIKARNAEPGLEVVIRLPLVAG